MLSDMFILRCPNPSVADAVVDVVNVAKEGRKQPTRQRPRLRTVNILNMNDDNLREYKINVYVCVRVSCE